MKSEEFILVNDFNLEVFQDFMTLPMNISLINIVLNHKNVSLI